MDIYNLEWPPSFNTCYVRVGGSIQMTGIALQYRRKVKVMVKNAILNPVDPHRETEAAQRGGGPTSREAKYPPRFGAKSPLFGPIAVLIVAHPPVKRRRDCDNFQKTVIDALQSASVFMDDSQIKLLVTLMMPTDTENPRVTVHVGTKQEIMAHLNEVIQQEHENDGRKEKTKTIPEKR